MMSESKKDIFTISSAVALAAFCCATISWNSSQADSKAESLRVVQGSAKTYALALPPKGKASGGNAGLGFTSSSAMLSLIHISEPTRPMKESRMPCSA